MLHLGDGDVQDKSRQSTTAAIDTSSAAAKLQALLGRFEVHDSAPEVWNLQMVVCYRDELGRTNDHSQVLGHQTMFM